MAEVVEKCWQGEVSGLVVTRYGHGANCQKIEVVEAAHPVPDAAGLAVAKRVLELVSNLSEDDRVIFLLSGGGSALLALPAEGLTLADKQQINKALLKSGATIGEMNCVRKHLSAIKGGRLAKACWPATVYTYAISDVPGDLATVIASGPTVADPSTSADALAILKRYNIEAPKAVIDWLNNPASETVKADDPALARSHFQLIAKPQQSLEAAAVKARQAGFSPLILGDLEGESREVAKVHAGIARQIVQHGQPLKAPCVILSGGETTVTVRGNGRGGRNAEFLLSLTESLKGLPGVYALAGDTDGIDGSEENAGAFMTPASYARAEALGLSASDELDNNNGYGYFAALDALIVTEPNPHQRQRLPRHPDPRDCPIMTPDKKVKILATLGPAIKGIDDIRQLVEARGEHLPPQLQPRRARRPRPALPVDPRSRAATELPAGYPHGPAGAEAARRPLCRRQGAAATRPGPAPGPGQHPGRQPPGQPAAP
ncbi:hydroxypyruvate reductase [Pseudomonas putida S11]|nr:hydroxypyruvate reductase [Pseudomonas putida S11]